MAVKKSGAGKFVLMLISSVALAYILWVVYQSLDLAEQDDLEVMGIIPEQTVQQAYIEEIEVPTATIPQPAKEQTTPEQEVYEEIESPKVTLPPLDKSDDFLRDLLITDKANNDLDVWLRTDDLMRRIASYLDGLARGSMLSKIFSLSNPQGEFTTHQQGDIIWLNAGNYERYNNTLAVIMALDMQQIAGVFHLVRPLLESAFAELGYKPRQMDGIILRSLDNILATPVIVEPLQLVRESVTYKFADPKLEALMPLQKQLLRAGPENTQRIQQQALALKKALLNP